MQKMYNGIKFFLTLALKGETYARLEPKTFLFSLSEILFNSIAGSKEVSHH